MTNSFTNSNWLPRLAPILVLVLAIPFIAPFFASTFPDSGDGLLNLYRVVALDFAIKHGDLWPRFATALHFGYGSPTFNYYAPLSLYGVELVHLLGFDASDAYRIAVMAYALMGALGAYLLGNAASGRVAGVVTAVAYLYAPPLFDSFNRTGQFAAILLLPWVLWVFWRLAVHRRRRDFVLAVVLFGAMLLMHNVTALYAAPIAAVWAIYAGWRRESSWRALVPPVLALITALGLTTFFWLPALAEADFVQLNRLDIPQFDYHENFLPITQTFALPMRVDGGFGVANAATIGWPQLLLGIIGLGLALAQRGRPQGSPLQYERVVSARDWAIFAAIIFALSVFFTTRASVWLWDHLPLVKLLLFPSRLLYGASLMLALLAGIGAASLLPRIKGIPGQVGSLVVICGAIISYQLPGLHTNPIEKPSTASIHDIHDFERNTGWIGATSAGEFLPIWVKELPPAWAMRDRLFESDTPPRLRPNDAVKIRLPGWELKGVTLVFQASQPTTLVFEWMYFPGWQAELDNEPVEVRPTDPEGLIAVDVPEGDHELVLYFRRTPVRMAAEWISIGALVALVVVLSISYFRKGTAE